MQLIKVNAENKLRNDRISELENHIFQFQKFQTLRGTESQADQGLDESKILAEKLRGCEVIVEEKAEESRSLRKKLSEMEWSYQQVRYEYDALKDKLASVRELESYDSHSSEEETEHNGGTAKSELLQRIKNLEGLLQIKEMSEKELTQVSKELESQLSQKRENERLLNLRCAKFDQLTKQKEDVERKLEERYSQVEQMQKERDELEEENQEQMKMLLDEIKERDEAYAQLEMINKDLSRKTREMEETRICLEAKIDQLKMDLEEGIHREVIIKKQFSDLEQTVRDWEHIEQQLREQFKQVEGKLNAKIKRLCKRVEEKDEALERSTQAIEELKKSGKEAEHLLHERQKIPPEILQEKVKLEEELSRMVEAELIKAGSIVKMTSRFEMELNEKSRELEKLTDEIESLNEEIGELQEQLRQHKESERKLQERNKMMEELLQDKQEGESKMLQDKIARMEKLLLMKEDTEEKLQVRIGKQVSLLKEMAETQRRLAQRNEELGLKQRRLSEDLHQWRVKFSDLEKGEREARNELIYQKDRVNELEAANSNLKVQLKNKSHEFEELDFSKKEKEHLMAELNKKIEELVFKESVCQAENASLETHLKKRTKELEASEASKNHLRKQLEETLEGKEHEVKKVKTASEQERRVLETHLFQKSLLITSLETMIQEERQLSVSLKHEVQNKELAVKKQQEKWLELQTRIQGFKQDLEEAKSERTRQVSQSELDTLRQRLEECVQSEKTLKKTISNFIKAEAALQSRIQDLERAEKQLLGKIDELNSKSLQPETNEPHLAGKLQSLQVSERTLTAVLAERERADAVVRRNLWHSENHLRMKEEEVKKQCEYFEHHQQKQRQQLAELREHEHWMQDRVYELERGMVESKAANAMLRAELQKATANASLPTTELPEEGSFPLGGLDDIKNHIETLEQDLKRLLEREEAGEREKEKLHHSLQQAEDNKDFLGHKLEDLRSRIQELKLSEGSLQEQVEELEGETRKLRAELEVKEESEEYLREVLEEKEKLKLLMEERCQPPESALNENESDFNTGEVQLQQDIAQKESSKHKQLSSLCSAIFHHVVSSHSGHCTTEEQSSPSRYRDLKNSLSHLRSQLQNGDILFREELLREKWASLLDPSRNKAIQTPSIGQCVQEAMIIAKLASECIYDYPKLSEAIKEGRLTPLMESHSSPLAEMMQALRSSDVEQVRVVLKRPETQKELARLLGCEREQLAREEDISSSLAEKPGTSERVQKNTKYGDDIINTKEITRHVVVTMDPDISQSQAALLKFANQKVSGTKSSSTFLHTREPDSHNLSSSQLNVHEESSSTEAMTYTVIITTLEAEIQKLQTEKAELDQHLQSKHSLLLKATAERSELQKKLCASESQVNDLSQKLDAVMQEKMKEEETMKNNLRKENEVLEKRNKELRNRIAKQETERREMEAEFQEAKENSLQNVSKLVEEKQKLEQQLTSVQRVNAQQLLECHQTAQEMDAQNEELKKRIAQLEIKDKILVDATTGLKEEIEKGKQENNLLFNKMNRLENEKAEAGQQNAQLLKRENEELSEKVNILESKAEQYDAQITALQHKLNRLEHENSKLMRLKENQIEGMDVKITDEKGKLVEAAETLEQPNEQSLEDTPLVTEDREAILKTQQVFSLSKGLVRQKYAFNDALAESPVEKDIGGTADDSKLGSNEVSRQEECLTKLTREVVGLSLAEGLVMNDTASEVVNYCDQNELLECATQEKDELNKVQQSVLMEAEAVFTAGDVLSIEEDSQAKEVPVNQPRIEAKVEVSLRADNSQLKEQLCALDEWSCKAQALEASSELMKREFEKMGKRKTEAELLVAPLKVKVSCLVQKCHDRNSLIVRLVKELHGCGFINMGLMEEAEDLLNDTAVLEYTKTFLPSYSQVGNMKISGSSAGNPDQGLDPNNLGSLSSGRETIMDSGPSLTYKSCVANADYHPSANMPHTVLPVLSLSVGDMIRVTGFPDSHGLYHTEVNGILGLVPASFLEEADDVHHAHTPQIKSILNPQLSSPERILEFYQQLQQGHSSNYQVTPSMTIFSPNEEPVERPLVSRLHNELECPISEICRQTTVEQQAQHHLLPSADPAQCCSGDCSADDLKSTQGCRENTSETCQLIAAGCNLSDVLTQNLRETHEWCTKATIVQGVRGPTMAQEPPPPVVSVRIIKIVGQSSLMVDWEKPCVDEKGSSNDTSVQGYRIFIDGEFHKSVMGSDCTKTVLEDLDLTVPFQVSVQTVGVNSLVSGKVTVLFQNCRPQKKSLSELSCLSTAIHSSDCTEKFQEIKSSQDCSLLSTRNPKARMFLAIYDYHPLQDSPNIHPSHELAFKEGDIVWTLGKQRRDGFYEAEVNGRRGLAPVSFLEEVNIGLPKTLQQKVTKTMGSSPGDPGLPNISSCSEHLHNQNVNRRLLLKRV